MCNLAVSKSYYTFTGLVVSPSLFKLRRFFVSIRSQMGIVTITFDLIRENNSR